MKVIEKSTGTVIGTVVTNRSLTLDEAMELIGYPWVTDEDNGGYKVGDIYYDEGDLEMVYDD